MDPIVLIKQDVTRIERAIALFDLSRQQAVNILIDPTTGDSWHDESFARSDIMQSVFDQLAEDMRGILKIAKVITPEEQSETIKLRSGVKLEHVGEDRVTEYVLVGYALETTESRVKMISARSPLGKCIIGARVGETRELRVGETTRTVQIVAIYSPSQAYQLLQ